MILYTCPRGKDGRGVRFHACARAGRALDEAGYEYDVKRVNKYRLLPWRRGQRDRDRAEVRELSGWNSVPILVLDDGEVIAGSGLIVRWARENPGTRVSEVD